MEGSSFVSKDSHTEGHDHAADKLLCNICDLEPLRDPVVTSCGHLYCWPCLNKRLQSQSQKHCLACASPLVHSANFIKIYGTDSQPLNEQSDLECRICLESPPPTNAVATSCGHVFCWPCLYQWLHTHHQDQGPCPVCKNVLKRGVNILPVCGNHELHAGNDLSSNVGTIAEAAEVPNSGGFITIPPRPCPPEDAFALSSRKYATSDNALESVDVLESVDELESDDEQESDDELESDLESVDEHGSDDELESDDEQESDDELESDEDESDNEDEFDFHDPNEHEFDFPENDAELAFHENFERSDDEIDFHDPNEHEFDFPENGAELAIHENFDPSDDEMSSADEPCAEIVESLILAAQGELGESTFRRLESALRRLLRRELLRWIRSL